MNENSIDIYDKSQIDALLENKADVSNVYTKADVYTKSEANDLLSAKADTSDVYTKSEANDLLSAKADTSDVYTKTQVDTALAGKQDNLPEIVSGDARKVLAINANEDGYEYINNTEIKLIASRTELINWIKNDAKVGNILSFAQYSDGWSAGLFDGVLSVTFKSSTQTRFSGQCRYKTTSADYPIISLVFVHESNSFTVEYKSSISANGTVNNYSPPGSTFSGCSVR